MLSVTQETSPSPTGTASANPLLDSLLAAFGTKPEKTPRKKSAPKAKTPEVILPVPQAFAKRKTGYVTWKATARVLQVQEQECKCCGAKTTYVKAEFFQLENGTAHATWLRPEGYGIHAPADLPIVYSDLEPAFVTACASCRSTPFDDLLSLFSPKQMELPL